MKDNIVWGQFLAWLFGWDEPVESAAAKDDNIVWGQ